MAYEYAIPHCAEMVGISTTTAKERCRVGVIGYQRADLCNIPQPSTLRVRTSIHGLLRCKIASIGQGPVAVDGVVAVPEKFVANCGFTGAGNAIDQEVFHAYVLFRVMWS